MSIFTTKYSYQPHPDGDGDPFDDNFLMQDHNREAAISADDPSNDISDLSILRRERTRAPDLFKYVDDTMHFQGLAVDDDDLFEKMSRDYGTSHELARKYNGGSQAEKDRIKQGVDTALAWEAKATNPQRAAQRRAAEKIGDYKTASNGPRFGGGYDDMGNLTAAEVESFFRSTPEARKAIAKPLNTALQPWAGTYDPATPAPRVTAIDRWDLTEEERNNRLELAGARTFQAAMPKSRSGLSAGDEKGAVNARRPKEEGGGFLGSVERFIRKYTPTRYGNFGGRNWSNGKYDPNAKISKPAEFDSNATDTSKPIDVLDLNFQIHDQKEIKAIEQEMKGNLGEARAIRRQSDLLLVGELKVLLKRFNSGDLKLGIEDSGVDNRTRLLGVDDPVEARKIMENAIIFFTWRANNNDPENWPDRVEHSGP